MITIKDLANILLAKHQVKQTEAEIFIQQMVEVINDGLARDRQVKIKGFGTFKLQTVKERASVNVNTGERVVISEHDKVTFTPDNVMKDIINKPFSQFETVIVADDSPLLDESFEISTDEEEEEIEVQELPKVAEQTVEETPKPETVVEETPKPETVVEETPKPETVVEETPKPEPIVEETPKPEPVVEETQEPESVVEETPKPEPIVEETQEPETVVEEKPEAPVMEKQEKPEELCEDEILDTECNKQYPHCRNIFIYYGILINIIVALIAFAAGYFACQNHWFTEEDASAHVEVVTPKANRVVNKVTSSVHQVEDKSADTVKATAKDAGNAHKKETQQPKQTKDIKQTEDPKIIKQTEEIPLKGYDYDPRVRTGAYYIMGTDKEVVLKEGQTLKSISRTYLGPDMECYVEVYNKKEVKPGDKVKIPKLKLKKLLRKNN